MSLQQLLFEPLQFEFMQRALLALLVIGCVNGVMGAYVVTRGMAFLSDALAHSVLPGVAIAFATGGAAGGGLLIGGILAGAASALVIGLLTRGRRLTEDTAIGIVFTGMLALGIAIISATRSFATDLSHALIGSILSVRADELLLIVLIGGAVLLLIALFYKELLLISFDSTLAQTLRLPGEPLRLGLLVLLVALVAATIITPAATARFFTQRLHRMMLLASVIGAACGIIGLYLAWHLRVEASATIVLTMTVGFLLAFLLAPERGYLWAKLRRTA
jgi:manganese/iron transport system permease protein